MSKETNKFNVLESGTCLKDYSPILIFEKDANCEAEFDKTLTYSNSLLKKMVNEFNLSREDFELWDNYGSGKWLIIKKEKVNNTYYMPRSFLFLEFSEVGNKVDFGDCKYEITSKTVKEPDKLSIETWKLDKNNELEMKQYSNTSIQLTYIKKDKSLGIRTCWISNYPSPVDDTVNIEFSR